VMFLASPYACFENRHVLPVTGGPQS